VGTARPRWKRLEDWLARYYGGKRVPMSGAGAMKEDVFGEDPCTRERVLVQAKSSGAGFVSISRRRLDELVTNATQMEASPRICWEVEGVVWEARIIARAWDRRR